MSNASRTNRKASAARIRKLRAALRRSMVALDDWLHCYASDQCSRQRVQESSRRVYEAGGTLAYLADVQQQNREAMK